MKKLLYVAVMALTMGLFASCGPRASIGREPEIDNTNATINGVHYDNTEYACWKFEWEWTEKENGTVTDHDSGFEFMWTTQFEAQKVKAAFDYSHNVGASAYGQSYSLNGTSTLTKTDHNESNCGVE